MNPMLSEPLAQALIRFSSTLVSDFAAEIALDELMAATTVELGVDGAGVMLDDDEGELRFVSASDETVRLIERFQVETGEGPCVMATETGQSIFVDDLNRGDERFPTFVKRALAAGLESVHSFPMLIEGHRLGAMNLYRWKPGPLSESQQAAGRIFADMATAYLISARRADRASRMVEEMRQALDRSAAIEQAKGYVASMNGFTPAEAFDPIRAYARRHRLPMVDVSRRILDGHLGLEDLTAKS